MPEIEEDDVPEDLFKGVTFYIVGEIEEHIIELLTKYGGKRDTYLSEMVSHVIADDVENHEYQEARELFELPCVMSEWVLFSVKCRKMLDKEMFAPEGQVFSGVVACPSKLEEQDWLSLWGMIVYHGGRCHAQLTNRTTHLITAATDGPKYEAAVQQEDTVKVVAPDWVPACLDKGTIQDELPFHPRFIQIPKPPSPPKPPTPPKVESPPKPEPMEMASVSQETGRLQLPPLGERRAPGEECLPPGSRPNTPGSASTKEALAKLVNNRMQELPHQRPPHPMHMAPQGYYQMPPGHPGHPQGPRPGLHPGQPPRPQGYPPGSHPGPQMPPHGPPGQASYPPHSHHPGMPGQHMHPQLQQQHQHQQQQQQQKLRNITNNMDLHKQQQQQHQQQQQQQHHQQQQQLHQQHQQQQQLHQQHQQQQQQQQQGGKQGQQKSFYGGQQQGMGPRAPPPQYFPAPLGFPSQQPQWPQYWGHDPSDNVPADMCLLGCIFYINDYPKLVGPEQIAIWKKVIEQHGGQVDPSYSNRVTHVLCAHQKTDVFLLALRDQRRIVTAYWLNDVLLKKKMMPPWQALHIPLLYSDENRPCSNQIISITNFDGEDRLRVKQLITALGAKYTGYMSKTNSALVCRSPDGEKYGKAKEWQIPVVNVQWLSDLVLGHVDALRLPIDSRYLQVGQGDEFQMDLTKVPNLMAAWRTPLKVSKETWKRFSPNIKKNMQAAGQENMPANVVSPAKKLKLEPESSVNLAAPGPRVCFTGFPRGVARRLQAVVVQLGGQVAENPVHCSHLVAATFSRTMKFFLAINTARHILNKHWLEDSCQKNAFVNEAPYVLQDPVGEAEIKCSLMESLRRAHTQRLFAGLTFHITPSVQPPVCDLKKVIESAGGIVPRKPRLAAKTVETLKDDMGNPTYIVITCADDIHLCQDLLARNIKVHSAEFVLTGVLKQEKSFQQYQIDIQR